MPPPASAVPRRYKQAEGWAPPEDLPAALGGTARVRTFAAARGDIIAAADRNDGGEVCAPAGRARA